MNVVAFNAHPTAKRAGISAAIGIAAARMAAPSTLAESITRAAIARYDGGCSPARAVADATARLRQSMRGAA